MPYFITTLHIAIEADHLNDANARMAALEMGLEELDVLSETAFLLGSGVASLVEIPAFDPERDDLHAANGAARGGAK